uniref:uncharacterized protein n=1 Tax=Myxine glutinosa TaxID=7769 RepID=UPI00358FAEA6
MMERLWTHSFLLLLLNSAFQQARSCTSPPSWIDHGELSNWKKGFQEDELALYECNKEYILIGQRVCVEGAWLDRNTQGQDNIWCKRLKCLVTSNDLNSRSLHVPDTFRNHWREKDHAFVLPLKTSFEFTCHLCKEIQGTKLVECNEGVVELPECQAVCCSVQEAEFRKRNLKVPPNFQHQSSSIYTFAMNIPVAFQCEEDHSSNMPLQRTCRDGQLDLPKCTPDFCDLRQWHFINNHLEVPEAYKKIEFIGPIFSIQLPRDVPVALKCEQDYVTSERLSITCKDGHVELPKCRPDRCEVTEKEIHLHNLSIPSAMHWSHERQERVLHVKTKSKFTFHCLDGLTLSGTSPQRTCFNFHLSLPTCKPVYCKVTKDALNARSLIFHGRHERYKKVKWYTPTYYEIPYGGQLSFLCEDGKRHQLSNVQARCQSGTMELPLCGKDSDLTCKISQQSLMDNNLIPLNRYRNTYINNSFVHQIPEGEKVNFDCMRGTSAPDLTRACMGGLINLPTCQERCKAWLINRGGIHTSVKGFWLPEISVKCPAHHITYTDAIRCLNIAPEADIQCCPEHPQIPDGSLKVERPMNEHGRNVTIQAKATCTTGTRLVGSEVITCRGSRWPTEMLSCQSGDFKMKQTHLWNVSLPNDADMQEEDGGKVTFRARSLREARLTWNGPALPQPTALCYSGKIYWRFMVIRDGIVSEELEGRDEQDCFELLQDTKQSTSSKIEVHLLFHEFSISHSKKDEDPREGIEKGAHCRVTKEELNSRFLVVPERYERYKEVKWYNLTTYHYWFPLNIYVTFHCEDGTKHLLMNTEAHCDLKKMDLPLCGADSDLTCLVSEQLLRRNNLRPLQKYQHTYVEHFLAYKIPEGDTVNFVCKSGSSSPNLTQTCTNGLMHLPTCEKGCKSWLINQGGMQAVVQGFFVQVISVTCPTNHVSYANTIRCLKTGPETEIQCCHKSPQIPKGDLKVENPIGDHGRNMILQARATCTKGTRLVGSEVITCQGSRWPTETLSCQPDDVKNEQVLQWNISLSKDAEASEESGRRLTFEANYLREAQLSWLGPALSRPTVLCYTGKTYWQLKVLRKDVITEELEGRDEQGCLELLVNTSDSSSSNLQLHLLFHKFSFNYMIQPRGAI